MEKLPSPENLESEIEKLLGALDNYALDQFPDDAQDALADEWYFAEVEARNGRRDPASREQALADLRAFLEKLAQTPKKAQP